MLDQFFSRPATIPQYHGSPYAAERQHYLSHLAQEGRSKRTLGSLLPILNSLERHLPLEQAAITQVEIEAAAEMWATTVHRSPKCLHVGKRAFVFHATNWLRLLGRLYEPRVEQPFAAEMDAVLQFCISERALAPDTIRHYRLYIGEFLIWLDGQDKTLRQVNLEDISVYINGLSQRRLSRTTLAIHVAKLRNFFRYAESKRWCRTGLAAIDAPRIYSLESLPRGPQWSDVQRLLASCAGDGPTEIRDHVMLLLIAVYGLRSGEVRHLCLEDIDWEREIIHIRRSKQRKSQQYPLVHEVGAAILPYLREVRPRSKRREIFLIDGSTVSNTQCRRVWSDGAESVCIGWRSCQCPMDLIRLDIPALPIFWRKEFRSRRLPTISATFLWLLLRSMRRLICRDCAKWATCPWLNW